MTSRKEKIFYAVVVLAIFAWISPWMATRILWWSGTKPAASEDRIKKIESAFVELDGTLVVCVEGKIATSMFPRSFSISAPLRQIMERKMQDPNFRIDELGLKTGIFDVVLDRRNIGPACRELEKKDSDRTEVVVGGSRKLQIADWDLADLRAPKGVKKAVIKLEPYGTEKYFAYVQDSPLRNETFYPKKEHFTPRTRDEYYILFSVEEYQRDYEAYWFLGIPIAVVLDVIAAPIEWVLVLGQ